MFNISHMGNKSMWTEKSIKLNSTSPSVEWLNTSCVLEDLGTAFDFVQLFVCP